MQRHLVGAVDGDAVVEVDRVEHPAEAALALALDLAVERVDAGRRPGVAADALLDRLGARLVAQLPGVDRDLLAPLLTLVEVVAGRRELAARGVADEEGRVAVEHDEGLLRQVDLDVLAGIGAPGVERQRVLQRQPHVRRDDAVGLVERDVHDQLLVGPHRHPREVAELPVDRTGLEADVLQALLQGLHLGAGHPLAQRAGDRRLRDRRRRRRQRRRGRGGGQAGRAGHRGGRRRLRAVGVGIVPGQHADGTDGAHRADERHGSDDRRQLGAVEPGSTTAGRTRSHLCPRGQRSGVHRDHAVSLAAPMAIRNPPADAPRHSCQDGRRATRRRPRPSGREGGRSAWPTTIWWTSSGTPSTTTASSGPCSAWAPARR